MKYLIVGDVHWCAYSSIVRARGEKYSLRLENLIQTINWVEQEAVNQECGAIVYLGDFFDKAELNSEEITALSEIKWSNLFHWFLVGNHEMGISTLQYSSAHLFGQLNNFEVVNRPLSFVSTENIQLCFLPYVLEQDRKTLLEYFPHHEKSVVFSHNDLKGIQMGKFISQEGCDIEDIQNNCRLFFNGHLHNGSCVGKNIINVGNLTGQNFSEDSLLYRHNILVFDDTTFSVEWIENPYAFNFYRLDMLSYCPKMDDDKAFKLLSSLGPNAVVTLKTTPDERIFYEDLLSTMDNIIVSRVIMEGTTVSTTDNKHLTESVSTLDHLSRFSEYVQDTFGNDDIVKEELAKVIG